jgi:4-hydroxy-tetrahydrodipicolinate synthase
VVPSFADRLIGAYPVLPTPFHDDESLDLDGLGEIIDRVLARDIKGVAVLGTGAEVPYLTDEERRAVLEYTVKRVAGRASVVAGLFQAGTSAAVDQGKRLRDLGADALLLALPAFHGGALDQVITHFTAVVRDVGLPTLYGHQPGPTHLSLTPEDVGSLFREVALVGMQLSATEPADFGTQLREIGRPIALLTGQSTHALACLDAGGVGIMCPLGALLPLTSKRLVDEHAADHDNAAAAAQQRLRDASPFISPEGSLHGVVGVQHSGVKEALVAVGILKSAAVRHPQPRVSEKRRDEIRSIAARLVEL